jgi:hypothetical protein
MGVLALLVLAGPASGALPASGVFVGKAGKTAFGVALDRGGVVAYACDGRRLGTWFSKSTSARSKIRLRRGAQRLVLSGSGDKVRARFARRTTFLRRATGAAGLFRSEATVGGRQRLGGWIVLRSGRQVGVVATGTRLATAPRLSTTSLTAGSLVAAPVIAPFDPLPLVADLDNDGLDITGTATTTLVGGGSRSVRWTRPNDDDGFVAFDSAVLANNGFRLSETGTVLARGGIRVTRGSTTTTAVDGFHLLRLLDGNADGRITSADATFAAGRVFLDSNGDGSMDESLQSMADAGLASLSTQAALERQQEAVAATSRASKSTHDILLGIIRNLR